VPLPRKFLNFEIEVVIFAFSTWRHNRTEQCYWLFRPSVYYTTIPLLVVLSVIVPPPLPTSTTVAWLEFYQRLSTSGFPHDISKTDAAEAPNVIQKCSTMSPGNQFIMGSKGQESRVENTLQASVFALLWVLADSSSIWHQLSFNCTSERLMDFFLYIVSHLGVANGGKVERRRREDRGAEGADGSGTWGEGAPFPKFFCFFSSKNVEL